MSKSGEKCDIFNILEIDNMCEYVSEHCIQNNFLNIYQLYFCDNFGKNVNQPKTTLSFFSLPLIFPSLNKMKKAKRQ